MAECLLRYKDEMVSVWVDKEDVHYLLDRTWYITPQRTASEKGFRVMTKIDGKTVYLHNMVMKPSEGYEVDHINNNPLDNRKSNLRITTRQQNLCNRAISVRNTSGYKGVCFNPKNKTNPWFSQIKTEEKLLHLGSWPTPELAYEAYKEAALKHHGEFANLG